MFINALVFINSSVVYKLWGGEGGGGGGVLEHKLKSPHPPPPFRLASGTGSTISGCRA